MWSFVLVLMACSPCGNGGPCAVDGGRYFVAEPNVEGDGPLPAMVFFHAYGGTAERLSGGSMEDKILAQGALAVFPDGMDKTWAHQGSPSDARDETAFVRAVLDDLEDRYDIDRSRLIAGGFSQGGSMTWHAACFVGERFSAFAPAAGAFWDPHPTTCNGPVHLRHTHGLNDPTVPMEGRPIGPFHQGDVLEGMAQWRAINGCAETPDRIEPDGPVECQVWDHCSSGKQLRLCLHEGEHQTPGGWTERVFEWHRSEIESLD